MVPFEGWSNGVEEELGRESDFGGAPSMKFGDWVPFGGAVDAMV